MEPKQAAPYPLRMPPKLRESIEEQAEAAGRSINAEIVQRLEASLDAGPPPEVLQALLDDAQERISMYKTAADSLRRDMAAMTMILKELAPTVPETHAKRPFADMASHYTSWAKDRVPGADPATLGEAMTQIFAEVKAIEERRDEKLR